MPRCFAGEWGYPPNRLTLRWRANAEADLLAYRVYRGEGSDFVPSESNVIATTPDTVITGLRHLPVPPWYLKLSAIDIHGNESDFAVLAPESTVIATLVSSYQATWKDKSVEVRWKMSGISSDFDYRVSRRMGAHGNYETLTCEIIEDGTELFFLDRSTEPGRIYTYRVSILEKGEPVGLFETSITTPALKFSLKQNHPNPFNPTTQIDFSLNETGPTTLRIYDVSGKLVRTLVNRRMMAGWYSEEWDGRDAHGVEMASGVYFIRLEAGRKTFARKAIILR
jgi:hypothetical protein